GERQVRVELDRLLEGAERFAIALQLDQRRTLQRERERRVPELRACPLGEVERLLAPPVAAEQLEALGPAWLEIGVRGQHVAIGLFRVTDPSLPRQVASAGHHPLPRRVRKQLVRRGRPHGEDEYTASRVDGYAVSQRPAYPSTRLPVQIQHPIETDPP